MNTARGGVVDEEGMRRGLEDGRVRVTCRFVHTTMLTVMTAVFFSSRSVDLPQLTSVGLDVYPDKPQVKPRLFAFPQNVLLPHVGVCTHDSERKLVVCAMTNLRDFLLTGSARTSSQS